MIIPSRPFALVGDKWDFKPISSIKANFDWRISFGFWLFRTFVKKHLLPYKTEADEADEEALGKLNEEIDEQRNKLIEDFVKPGQMGVKFKGDAEAIKRNLRLKKDVQKDLGIDVEDGEGAGDQDPLYDLYSDGKSYITPQFFCRSQIKIRIE